MNEETSHNGTAKPPSGPASFTVCPRCNYPHKDAHQAAAGHAGGKIGGKAKVKKGFAVIGQPSTEARKLGWVKRKAKAEAKAKAKAEATAQPPQ